MNSLIELAMQIILCLLIAAVIGAIIGYLLGKMSRCNKGEDLDYDDYNEKRVLSDYTDDDITYLDEGKAQGVSKSRKNLTTMGGAGITTATLSGVNSAKESLTSNAKKVVDVVKEDSSFVTGPGQEVGIRPRALEAPIDGEADDLKEISGIGIKIEEVLNSLNIYHFEQIAEWTPENVEWIENYLTLKGRIVKEDWIGQAKLLAAGGQTEFSKKVRRGENRNYR